MQSFGKHIPVQREPLLGDLSFRLTRTLCSLTLTTQYSGPHFGTPILFPTNTSSFCKIMESSSSTMQNNNPFGEATKKYDRSAIIIIILHHLINLFDLSAISALHHVYKTISNLFAVNKNRQSKQGIETSNMHLRCYERRWCENDWRRDNFDGNHSFVNLIVFWNRFQHSRKTINKVILWVVVGYL